MNIRFIGKTIEIVLTVITLLIYIVFISSFFFHVPIITGIVTSLNLYQASFLDGKYYPAATMIFLAFVVILPFLLIKIILFFIINTLFVRDDNDRLYYINPDKSSRIFF